jgi:PAS domain S-box-containing protein
MKRKNGALNLFYSLWHTYKSFVQLRTSEKHPNIPINMDDWRNRLFTKFITYVLPSCFIALVPGVYMSLTHGYIFIGVADLMAVVCIAVISFTSRLSLQVKKVLVILIFYALSVILLVKLSIVGPGFVYLLTLSVIVTLTCKIRLAYLSVFLNFFICVASALIIHFNLWNTQLAIDYSLGVWITVSSNLIFLSFIIVMIVGKTIQGLEKTIIEELLLKKDLHKTNLTLLATNSLLKESEAHYMSLFFQSPTPMWVLDMETLRFLQVNEAAVLKYKYTEEEFLKMKITDIKFDNNADIVYNDMNRSKETGTPQTLFTQHIKKDGELFHVEVIFNTIPFNGKPATLALSNDLTERMQYIASIQLQDEKLQQVYSEVRIAELEISNKTAQIDDLLENITDGFIALDNNRCYTYANKQIGKMLGVSPDSLIGKNIWELFPDVIGSSTYIAIEQAFKEKKYIINEDHYEPLQLWQENRIYPSGTGLSIFIRDISKRKRQEELKLLLSSTSQAFNEETELNQSLCKVLEMLVDFGNFAMAEAWLIESDFSRISRAANFSNEDRMGAFFKAGNPISFAKGEGLPGTIWNTEVIEFWQDIDKNSAFLRASSAKKAGLKAAYGSPLFYRGKIIGVLVLGTLANQVQSEGFISIMDNIGAHLGSEIKRKQLEQELNQVFNFTPDILCVANIDGYFRKVNPAMSILLEYSEEELLSKPFMDFVHPLDKQATTTELQNIINGKPTYYIENRYITKSGKLRWLAWTTTAASDQGILYCSAKDITDKKELEELLHKATNLARIGAWEVDMISKKVNWSEMTREIHETEPEFVPGIKSGINFYKEGESRDKISLKLQKMVETGAGFDVEVQIVTAKDNLKWTRVVGEAEFSNHKCIRMYGSFQDIDTLKRTEIIAKETLEERNNILESIGDAFFAVDKNWIVTYWNSSAEIVLQKTKLEMINYNLWAIFSSSKDSISYLKYHLAIELNQAMHFEDYYPPLDKWYEISAYPTDNGLSVYFKDITARKTSELLLKDLNASLQKQAKELAISNTELEQFAYVASHDLQEPLRMITSFLTQLELKYGDVVDEKGKKYIHFAVDGAKRMRQIILDLLEFSRVGKPEDNKEQIDVDEIIKDVLILYRKQIEEQNAIISYTNMPSLFAYKAPIGQIFQNLISNGLKYQTLGNHVQIEISCKDEGDFWKFAVSDNGIGIKREYFEKIFIIFQRLHNKDEYAGTGMGLAITKKIIENMGGLIWLESEERKGSTFYFTIIKENI